MESLHQLEIVILLLAAVLALTTVANKILIPYPILLVIGGLILGVLPGLPTEQSMGSDMTIELVATEVYPCWSRNKKNGKAE